MANYNLYQAFCSGFDPEAVFLKDAVGSTLLRYADVERRSAQLANYFCSLGLDKGDRVILQAEKSPAVLLIYFACLRAGLVFVPLNTAYKDVELRYFLRDAEPGLVICDPDREEFFKANANSAVLTLNSVGQGSAIQCESVGTSYLTVECDERDLACIVYTSGTTGQPKGAMISHANLLANAFALAEFWQWQRSDVLIHTLPVFHIHGLFIALHVPVLCGSTIIFLGKFIAQEVCQLLPSATVFMGVPTHYVRLLAEPALNKSNCNSIRLFTSGSAPMLLQTHREFLQRTGLPIVERYGMSETGVLTSNPIAGDIPAGSVGKPLAGVSLRVVAEDGNGDTGFKDTGFKDTGSNDTGSIQVKGANVFAGYWRKPERLHEDFTDDGYFITGDLGSIDANGFVTLSGRDKDLIITGGLNVYPKEIEQVIDLIPGVLESAVIGLPHADFGEAVTAILVLDGSVPLTAEAVIAQVKAALANFKVPKQIFFVTELPRNAMGKVQKNRLRETFA